MSHTMNWQTAVLALGALLIGFTFSMATQRFEDRKHILVDEANAIGTAYLRTRVVGDPAGEEIRALMRQYLDEPDCALRRQRAGAHRGGGASVGGVAAADLVAGDGGRARLSRPVMTGLLVATVNEMIDIADERRAVRENPVPYTAFVVLVLVRGSRWDRSATPAASPARSCCSEWW